MPDEFEREVYRDADVCFCGHIRDEHNESRECDTNGCECIAFDLMLDAWDMAQGEATDG